MRKTLCAFALFAFVALAQQQSIPLYPGTPPGSTPADYPEKAYFSSTWNTPVVTNVTKPSLTVFKPAPGTATGSAIVVCPGGGFMALSIESEGNQVAQWLAARGMTAFVLKYRLAHTGEDATREFQTAYADRQKFGQMIGQVVPQAIADGIAAVAYVRKHASEYGIDANKVGIVGFSAGGSVTLGAALQYTLESRPAFVAPIYGAASRAGEIRVPDDAPPMFIAAATDDQLKLAPDSVRIYQAWAAAGKPVELHMYSKGGHGFGMRKQGTPSDQWIDRFGDWLALNGFLKK